MSSKTLNVGVRVALVGSLLLGVGGLASADSEQHASITIRADGKSGTVTRARRSEKTEAAPLPDQINGGEIPRAALQAQLAQGIGRFLQQVRAEPVVSRGRFVGWRLATLFPNRTDVHVQGVRAGDVVLRVNGQSVERPEEFKAIWDTMATASELVLEIERAGEATTVRYTIK